MLYSTSAMVHEMLPQHISSQLKQCLISSAGGGRDANAREFIVDHYESVAVLFSEVRLL